MLKSDLTEKKIVLGKGEMLDSNILSFSQNVFKASFLRVVKYLQVDILISNKAIFDRIKYEFFALITEINPPLFYR